jgi:DNA-binding FrmR family transcriptional regulator
MEIKPMPLPNVQQSHVAEQLYAAERTVRDAKKTFINDHLDHCLDHVADSTSPEARASADEFKNIAKYL